MSKKQEHYLAGRDDRKQWAEDVGLTRCMACRKLLTGVWTGEIHEIERRSHTATPYHRCNFLLLCRDCHAGPFANMPHARQLAYKLLRDSEHFDLEAWLRLRYPDGQAPNRVTLREVVRELIDVTKGDKHAA
jgi:hypothetical protein